MCSYTSWTDLAHSRTIETNQHDTCMDMGSGYTRQVSYTESHSYYTTLIKFKLCVLRVRGLIIERFQPGLMPGYTNFGVVSLSKKLTHIGPVYLAVQWGPGINWGSSPPSCNITRYLVFTVLGKQMLNCPCLA